MQRVNIEKVIELKKDIINLLKIIDKNKQIIFSKRIDISDKKELMDNFNSNTNSAGINKING